MAQHDTCKGALDCGYFANGSGAQIVSRVYGWRGAFVRRPCDRPPPWLTVDWREPVASGVSCTKESCAVAPWWGEEGTPAAGAPLADEADEASR